MQRKWSEKEISYLKEIFENKTDVELAALLNRSLSSIRNKANEINLKKSTEHKSKIISKRNKMLARDLNYEILKEIASLYKTRSQFQLFDCSAYQTARRMNILDEICSHMIKPEIFNNILDDKYIQDICNKYVLFSDFRSNNIELYNKLRKLKKIDYYTSHMIKKIIWNDDKAKEIIKKYIYLKDFRENNYGCYIWVKKNNKNYLLSNLLNLNIQKKN